MWSDSLQEIDPAGQVGWGKRNFPDGSKLLENGWNWGEENDLAHQHDATLLDNGNILIFDNGLHRKRMPQHYSRIVEVNPKTEKIEWEYKADPPYRFYFN